MRSSRKSSSGRRESRFRRMLAQHRGERGDLITVLQKTQSIFGYLPGRELFVIAEKLDLSIAEVYGVATFYGQFRLSPSGKYLITVCRGTACHVAGAERISEALQRILKIRPGETTADGLFTLHNAACLGCCSLSPVMMIGGDVHGKLTAVALPSILKRYR